MPLTQGKDAYELEVLLRVRPPLPSSVLQKPQEGTKEGPIAYRIISG